MVNNTKDPKLSKALQSAVFNSLHPVVVTDQAGVVAHLNRAAESFLHVTEKTHRGTSLFQLLPPLSEIDPAAPGASAVQIGNQTCHVVSFALEGEAGKPLRAYLMLDNGESKSLKSELTTQKRAVSELEETLEGSFDGILVTDAEGKILYLNSSYERVAEVKRSDVEGKLMQDLLHPVWMPSAISHLVAEQRGPVSIRQVVKSGRHIIITGNPIFDKKGNIKKIVINARDITEIYELREEYIRAQHMQKLYQEGYSDASGDSEHHVLAVSESMQNVLRVARKVANFHATVLVQGESGVGKEEVAKFIHNVSVRRSKPFITVNCGAIPASLLESELFGYERGAFTGAGNMGKMGLLEAADGGVAFLDEIGEASLDIQVKLLRFLETREILRVGAVESKVVDVRVIAATHRDLEQMVMEGTFREDLYYRLNVVKIEVPPLRKRVEDIGPLALLFLSRYSKQYNQNKTLTYDVLQELERFNWTGNVRQLKNAIENMVIVSNNEYLQPEDLPWVSKIGDNPVKRMIQMAYETEDCSLQEATDALEQMILERAKETSASTREIADKLGINQSTVVRKLQKYGL